MMASNFFAGVAQHIPSLGEAYIDTVLGKEDSPDPSTRFPR